MGQDEIPMLTLAPTLTGTHVNKYGRPEVEVEKTTETCRKKEHKTFLNDGHSLSLFRSFPLPPSVLLCVFIHGNSNFRRCFRIYLTAFTAQQSSALSLSLHLKDSRLQLSLLRFWR